MLMKIQGKVQERLSWIERGVRLLDKCAKRKASMIGYGRGHKNAINT